MMLNNGQYAPPASFLQKQAELIKMIDDYLSEIIKSNKLELLPLSEQLHAILKSSSAQLRCLVEENEIIKARHKNSEDIRMQILTLSEKKVMEEEILKKEQEELREILDSQQSLEEECEDLRQQVLQKKNPTNNLNKSFGIWKYSSVKLWRSKKGKALLKKKKS